MFPDIIREMRICEKDQGYLCVKPKCTNKAEYWIITRNPHTHLDEDTTVCKDHIL